MIQMQPVKPASSSPPSNSLGLIGSAKSPSTSKNYNKALTLLNDFLKYKNLSPLPRQQIESSSSSAESESNVYVTEQAVGKVSFFQELAMYIATRSPKGPQQYFTADTALQHLSGAKMVLEKIFGPGFVSENDRIECLAIQMSNQTHGNSSIEAWYTKLRHDLESFIKRRCMDLGKFFRHLL